MLILSRKVGESVVIANGIEIQVISIKKGQVKIGITAPKKVHIHRKEVYEEIKSENIQAKKIDLKTLEFLENYLKKNT